MTKEKVQEKIQFLEQQFARAQKQIMLSQTLAAQCQGAIAVLKEMLDNAAKEAAAAQKNGEAAAARCEMAEPLN